LANLQNQGQFKVFSNVLGETDDMTGIRHLDNTIPLIERAQIIDVLGQALAQRTDVDAAWEGGSAAFKALDPYSDVDVVAVVANDAVDAVFAGVALALENLSQITICCNMPPAAGYRQMFFQLRDAGEFLVVDMVLIQRSDPLLFRDVELHGEGTIWFDKTGVLVTTHVNLEHDIALARDRIIPLRNTFAMFQHIPTKERLRGRAVEALHFYQGMTIRPLVEALRLLHCPVRRGFSVRYLARDLPPDVVQRLEALSFVADLHDLAEKHTQAQAWFWDVMASLDTQGPGGTSHD
jgi:hypothetical protein